MFRSISKSSKQYINFFGDVKIDLARELPELWRDVCAISQKNDCRAYIECNVISLYREHGSKLSVIKIVAGRDRHIEKVIRLVFEKPFVTPIKQYEMVSIDDNVPIWKEI